MAVSLHDYLGHLEPDDRQLAREYGEMDSAEFQARIGPHVHRLADFIEEHQTGRRWWDLRVVEIGRIAGSFVGGFIAGGGSSP